MRDYRFPFGFSRVKITGVWGGGEVPNAVSMVATKLIADFISNNEVNGAFEQENIEGYSYKLKSQAEMSANQKTLIDSIKHYQKILL
jgi:hypothetical protein